MNINFANAFKTTYTPPTAGCGAKAGTTGTTANAVTVLYGDILNLQGTGVAPSSTSTYFKTYSPIRPVVSVGAMLMGTAVTKEDIAQATALIQAQRTAKIEELKLSTQPMATAYSIYFGDTLISTMTQTSAWTGTRQQARSVKQRFFMIQRNR